MTFPVRARLGVLLVGVVLAAPVLAGCTAQPAEQTAAEACALSRDAVVELADALAPAVSAALVSPAQVEFAQATPNPSPAPSSTRSPSTGLVDAVARVKQLDGVEEPNVSSALAGLTDAASSVVVAISDTATAFSADTQPSVDQAAALSKELVERLRDASDAVGAYDDVCQSSSVVD